MENKCFECLCNNCKIGCQYPCNSCNFDGWAEPTKECGNFEDLED